MQSLKFLGCGNSLGFDHTNAYFETEDSFILLDISLLNVETAVSICPKNKKLWALISHMHTDCISGLALLIRICFEKYEKKFHILCGDADMLADINNFLALQGICRDAYSIDIAAKGIYGNEWFCEKINADPNMEMKNIRCYSYVLNISGRTILYISHFLKSGLYNNIKNIDEVYLPARDESWTPYNSTHYYENDYSEIDKIAEKTEVFLTHVDDVEHIKEKIVGSTIKLAEK